MRRDRESMDGEREPKRAIQHRPSPRACGRITKISMGGAQPPVRAHKAVEPAEGARGLEAMDGENGVNPTNERRPPKSARARPRTRPKVDGEIER